MSGLESVLNGLVGDGDFTGAIRIVDDAGEVASQAWGFADRRHGIENTISTRFGTASAAKAFTALVVMSLVEQGTLSLSTTARSLLGSDLPLIDDEVTVEHLLRHRSGIGDYLDEEALGDITEYIMSVPVHELDSTERYLRVLDGHATAFAPDTAFTYCNGGYVVLALLAERAGGTPFDVLVRERVTEPAGMAATAFLRSDSLPAKTALGYLHVDGLRTNVLHLPVMGTGDGGIYTTLSDIASLWDALFSGRIVSETTVDLMTRRTNDGYGLGFWMHESPDTVMVVGYDAGVAFRSVHRPETNRGYTIIANCSEGVQSTFQAVDAWFT